jgi:hypothetical protein
MVTGISTPLGYSVRNVAGFDPAPELGLHSLYYEDPLTSYSPDLNGGQFISPLTVANSPLYSFKFGLKNSKKINKKDCKKFNKNNSVNPSTGRPIKRKGKLYNSLVKKCKNKKLRISETKCVQFLESNKQINPLTGKLIKKDGKIYNLFMKKCVKYFDKNIKLSGSLPMNSVNSVNSVNSSSSSTQTDIPPMFVGRLPGVPNEDTLSIASFPSTSRRSSVTYSQKITPTNLVTKTGLNYEILNGKFPSSYIKYKGIQFKPGDVAVYDSQGNTSVIKSIGMSMIMFEPPSPGGKFKRIFHDNFITLNNSASGFGKKRKVKFIQTAVKKMRKKGTLGSFKKWCKRHRLLNSKQKVTKKCINAGKKSKSLKIRRRAIFAQNIRAYARK